MSDEQYFERNLARLLIALYYCGEPISSLLSGETRQVDSLWKLQQFDFWLREPGHLALALLHAFSTGRQKGDLKVEESQLRAVLDRGLKEDQVDRRRVPSIPASIYPVVSDLDTPLSFLTSCALISDRPSFDKSSKTAKTGSNHQVVLEQIGIELVQKIFAEAPSFGWYRDQGEVIAALFPILETYDLNQMPYLAPDLSPMMAVTTPLTAFVRNRYERIFPHGDADIR